MTLTYIYIDTNIELSLGTKTAFIWKWEFSKKISNCTNFALVTRSVDGLITLQ